MRSGTATRRAKTASVGEYNIHVRTTGFQRIWLISYLLVYPSSYRSCADRHDHETKDKQGQRKKGKIKPDKGDAGLAVEASPIASAH